MDDGTRHKLFGAGAAPTEPAKPPVIADTTIPTTTPPEPTP